MAEQSNEDETTESDFAALGLIDEITRSLGELGYEEATPIQRSTIAPLLDGRDLLGQAATGTGKTAAFALPMLQRLAASERRDGPFALVLVPTRELAMQVSEAVHRYGRYLDSSVLPVFGGQPIARQITALRRGVDIVVATPGRAIDHINRGTLALDSIAMLVLDEADEMFDMGFAEDIETILDKTPSERQTVLFSATMPPRIEGVTRRHLSNPERITVASAPQGAAGAPLVRQTAYIVHRAHKTAALARVLDIESPGATLVFCRTRIEVDELTQTLNGRGYRAEALHGGMNQDQRDRVMARLRAGTADLLVATDVAARGLDVDQLTHVVNFDVPSAPESYVHRIGRVGRAGREGTAVTLAEPREQRLLKNIERVTKQRIQLGKVPTVADLHSKRMDVTRTSVREAIIDGELDRFRIVVDGLADEFDVMEVALAAVKVAHEFGSTDMDEQEIPTVELRDVERADRRPDKKRKDDHKSHDRDKAKGSDKAKRGGKEKGRGSGGDSDDMVRLFVGAGRTSGIRPKDLVGAIANESNLRGRDIGAIEIDERHALVEVPAHAADEVIAALRGTHIKGHRPTIRRDRSKSR
jgi:ATP-dependent RNA helicase DeaD